MTDLATGAPTSPELRDAELRAATAPCRYFEDFHVGQVFVTPARTLTETDVVLFAGLSGDYNVLHTDAESAKQTAFGQRIAHGLLGLAVTSGLKQRLGLFEGTVIAFLGLAWEFRRPILLGDTIYARLAIAETRSTSKPDRGVVIQKIDLINQHGDVVQSGTHTVMMRRKPLSTDRERPD